MEQLEVPSLLTFCMFAGFKSVKNKTVVKYLQWSQKIVPLEVYLMNFR